MMNFRDFIIPELSRAYEEGFSFLKRIPASSLLAEIAYSEKNTNENPLDFLIKRACNPAFPSKEERHNRYLEISKEETSSWSYLSIRHRKAIIKNRLSIVEDEEEKEKLLYLKEIYGPLNTPSASETRKVFFPVLSGALESKPNNAGGGVWKYPVRVNNRAMELSLDFGGRFSIFRYHIDVYPEEKPQNRTWVSYESILGFSEQDWNLMRNDLLAEHAEVFLEAVKKTLNALSTATEG